MFNEITVQIRYGIYKQVVTLSGVVGMAVPAAAIREIVTKNFQVPWGLPASFSLYRGTKELADGDMVTSQTLIEIHGHVPHSAPLSNQPKPTLTLGGLLTTRPGGIAYTDLSGVTHMQMDFNDADGRPVTTCEPCKEIWPCRAVVQDKELIRAKEAVEFAETRSRIRNTGRFFVDSGGGS